MGKVLIVEDNQKVASLLKQYITEIDRSLEALSFSRAAEAYRYAKVESVELFILDIQLMDYKGTSLAKQLRALPQYKFTPIIFASALAGEELTMYRDVKCHSFLIKPFTKNEFTKAFRDALEMSNQMNTTSKTLRIEQKSFIFEYEVAKIVYVESFGKRVIIHSNKDGHALNQDTISGYSLTRLLESLSADNFIQCHKSYLVNRSYIRKIDKQEMILSVMRDDIKIPIGEKYKGNLWG
ncbi:LytR/AlgR family response regulator transcription factor [Proteiniclasticum ruminis]|uniref:LytR/AlgR family response regulator transcription factor n=1 Tax=Proteiniclasticum ruminis TaxID=398199 RepID=UPI0028AC3213|nr:LytTR family DNA-binding domain-containing protein [Proteiniclasticum ruminis]